MAAQIIQFRKCQKSRDVARLHGDIESRLAKLHEIAGRLFASLKADFDQGEVPGKE